MIQYPLHDRDAVPAGGQYQRLVAIQLWSICELKPSSEVL
jgi:hypothetical protein